MNICGRGVCKIALAFGWLLLVGSRMCSAQELQMRYLGVAGWEIRSGHTVVLIDPYLTRLEFDSEQIEQDAKKYFASYYPSPDTAAIDRQITRADFILVHHAHADHILDVPYIAKKTGAKVIGTESSMNILRAHGVAENQLYTVQGGEDYQFEGFSLRVIRSLHSPLHAKTYFDSRRYTHAPAVPLNYSDFIEGGSLMFLCRFAGTQIMTMGSMNFIEGELQGMKPDILLAGAGATRTEIYQYAERLLRATGYPSIVMPAHWDNADYTDQQAQAQAIKERVEPFRKEVAAASPRSKFVVPKHMKTMIVTGGAVEQ
ncbi:MBL fold metallo-hydrolase [Steroidobacter sp.]|uniref:MBL fold metallo-hydrolase n=1 Tax=Steroidobacter sp. TaxID=1978227 RepID=UPI001A4DFCC5|nr:MBL fold metallo-hydrolase [Steroidobacter sp.]MBL8271734.1 MBL fold metallo-hydrolase [Steroidobacter sp.]